MAEGRAFFFPSPVLAFDQTTLSHGGETREGRPPPASPARAEVNRRTGQAGFSKASSFG